MYNHYLLGGSRGVLAFLGIALTGLVLEASFFSGELVPFTSGLESAQAGRSPGVPGCNPEMDRERWKTMAQFTVKPLL